MTNGQSINFINSVFNLIKTSKTISELEAIQNTLNIHKKNRLKSDVYAKIEFDIKPEEIDELISNNIINKDLSFNEDITAKLTDPLSKILFATVWKNGDIIKIKHILKGILEVKNTISSQKDAFVFYQFGKYLTKTSGQPIIDQHVIRAFSLYLNTKDEQIDNLRKINKITNSHITIVDYYKKWLTSEELTTELKKQKDYTYHIDKLLFAAGKTVKLK